MKRLSIPRFLMIVGILAVILLGAGIILQQRVLSQVPEESPDLPAVALATPVPATDGGGFGRVEVGSPMPEPPTPQGQSAPNIASIPAAPAPAALPSNATSKALFIFDTDALNGWSFGQIFPDPIKASAWTISDGHLTAPDNGISTQPFNDTLAIAPTTLSGDGTIEASAFAGTASKIGLLVAYTNDQNYIALILSSDDAPDHGGLKLVRVLNGESSVIAQDTKTKLQRNRWYSLQLVVKGNQLTANIDGTPMLTGTSPIATSGLHIGLYAGSEGYAFFDNVRVLGQ